MNVRQVIPRDAIPSVDDPVFESEYGGGDDDEVIAVDCGGEPRAYPVRYLHYHEVVNDVAAGTPLAVTWCPLCGSAVVYERTVSGRTLEFGVSGKLADDDLVLYDRETESEWKQSSGVAFAGPLAGDRLTAVPAAMTTWAAFREGNPDGVVLAPPGGESEASGDGPDPEPIDYDAAPYERYFEREGFGLGAHRGTGGRPWDRSDVDPKAVVLGLELEGAAVGFPRPVVEDAGGAVTATVGGTRVVVFATDDGIHAYGNPGFEFEADGGEVVADGVRWRGATGESEDGRRLERLPARRLFAFAWQDDHGPAAFYGLEP